MAGEIPALMRAPAAGDHDAAHVDDVGSLLWLLAWQARVNADATLARIGRAFRAELGFEFGEAPYAVTVTGGRITTITAGRPSSRETDLVLRGSRDAWARFASPIPPPRYQSIFALMKRGEVRIEGDWRLLLQNLRAFTTMLEKMRAG